MCREVSSSSPVWPAENASWSERSSIWRSSTKDRVQDVKCLDPYVAKGRVLYPCGQCPSCRSNRRQIWTHRIMLEAKQHAENCFVTLTYASEDKQRNLNPDDLQKWIKCLRKRVEPRRVRYYCVGEYGDQSGHAHYHGAIFGLGCRFGPIRVGPKGEWKCHCETCLAIRGSWSSGHCVVGTLEERSAAYIAGYVLKKMNSTWDTTSRLTAPFVRMSLNPGIGAAAVTDVATSIKRYQYMERNSDVPVSLRHGQTHRPLGVYLRRRIRRELGLPENAPEEVIEALRQGLLPVFEYADVVCAAPGMGAAKRFVVKDAVYQINDQVNRNIRSKQVITRKKDI